MGNPSFGLITDNVSAKCFHRSSLARERAAKISDLPSKLMYQSSQLCYLGVTAGGFLL